MSEERFEQWLREHAADYNRAPGDVPRDGMWEAIAATRRRRHTPDLAVQRLPRRRDWMSVAAATLLLTVGAAVGYWARGAGPAAPAPGVAADPGAVDSGAGAATYEVASLQHFTAAEALLTSFRVDAPAESDQALRRWARDLLASTRLLMDSPAGDDAARRRLLEDLEYILAQIVQLDPDAPPGERARVEQSIGREQVLTRIRSSIPAGFPSGN